MVEKRTFHRPRLFYMLSVILGVILIAGFFVWRNYKYKLANQALKKIVTVKSKGLYQIHYAKLVINEAIGSVSVDNLEIVPDSSVYQSMMDDKKAPENLFFIHIPTLLITGVKTPKALLNQEIRAHMMRIENASFEIRTNKPDRKKDDSGDNPKDQLLYRQILGNLKSIASDSIIIQNSSVVWRDAKSGKAKGQARGFDIRLADLSIDSVNHHDSTRILFSKEITVHMNSIELPDNDQGYLAQLYGLNFDSRTGNFHVDQIKYKPKLSESAFAKSKPLAADRFDFEMGKLDIRRISRKDLLQDRLVADTLEFTHAFIRIFRDKSYPHDSVNRTHAYPQEAIMQLPIRIHIKKTLFRDSYIEYKEKNDLSDSSGTVAFHRVSAELDNVTNMRDYIAHNDRMILHFRSSFLNQASFSAVINMRLNDPRGRFTLDAQLGPLDAIALNPLLKPMALAELKKGKLEDLRFHLTATNTHATGKLYFRYSDIAIRLLRKDDDKNKYKTKVLPTLAAGIVFRDSNPKNGKMRVGDVDYARDIHRSMFNLMWKSLYSGIKKVAL